MNAVVASASQDSRRLLAAILLAALVCGAVDIVYAMTMANLRNGVAPMQVLQSVASGLYGRDAYRGGATTATLGLALHFGIMTAMVSAYLVASTRLPALASRPLRWGIAYGVVTFCAMNYVVIPLSAIGRFPPITVDRLASGLFAHVVLVGLPVALIAKRMARANRG
jgi:hypothetical protein